MRVGRSCKWARTRPSVSLLLVLYILEPEMVGCRGEGQKLSGDQLPIGEEWFLN